MCIALVGGGMPLPDRSPTEIFSFGVCSTCRQRGVHMADTSLVPIEEASRPVFRAPSCGYAAQSDLEGSLNSTPRVLPFSHGGERMQSSAHKKCTLGGHVHIGNSVTIAGKEKRSRVITRVRVRVGRDS